MGFRSLVEISHDDTRHMEADPAAFVADIVSYVRGASGHFANQLYSKYDVRVVGLRHSSDQYAIPAKTPGFPTQPLWEDFEKQRAEAVEAAKALTGGKRRSMRELETMITKLVEIINHQKEILDADP